MLTRKKNRRHKKHRGTIYQKKKSARIKTHLDLNEEKIRWYQSTNRIEFGR